MDKKFLQIITLAVLAFSSTMSTAIAQSASLNTPLRNQETFPSCSHPCGDACCDGSVQILSKELHLSPKSHREDIRYKGQR